MTRVSRGKVPPISAVRPAISAEVVFQTNNQKAPKPDNGTFVAFDHIRFIVGNAKQVGHSGTVRCAFYHRSRLLHP
ncbi:hypothetical protein ANCDUO_03345 [Ancylostoma duodenale]|uniref:Uncharacterized protein n=1 Tax=Ancylostoma duodenale TaxID=51022 RepID=A0A0C2DU45_9BILA|nr:hypothetical protein ANCDUO_03345 [Ancylostoma duodenale]